MHSTSEYPKTQRRTCFFLLACCTFWLFRLRVIFFCNITCSRCRFRIVEDFLSTSTDTYNSLKAFKSIIIAFINRIPILRESQLTFTPSPIYHILIFTVLSLQVIVFVRLIHIVVFLHFVVILFLVQIIVVSQENFNV